MFDSVMNTPLSIQKHEKAVRKANLDTRKQLQIVY